MKKEKIKLLFIDDEPHNLEALKATYRREWEIYTAQNITEANKIIEENEISIILSDHLMPQKTGVELLEEFSHRYPNISRILITAHADTPLIANAINRGKIHYFLEKPWNNETLRQAVVSCQNIFLINKELQEKNRQLQKINEDLNRFIYSASHEMRSPLMSILGLIDLIKQDFDKSDVLNYLDLMHQSVNDVDSYIQGIVEYYKNSKVISETQVIDFNILMDEIIEQYIFRNKDKINYQIITTTEEEFLTDASRLKIALGNMLSSAFSQENEKNEINIVFRVNAYEVVIEICEKENEILFNFVENVFKYFFNHNKMDAFKSSGKIMNLFLFKDALMRLNGSVSFSNNLGNTSYVIKIPSQRA